MAEKEYYLGGIGPYVYESTDSESNFALLDDGTFINFVALNSAISSAASALSVAASSDSDLESYSQSRAASINDFQESVTNSSLSQVSLTESTIVSQGSTDQSLALSAVTSATIASGISSEMLSSAISDANALAESLADSAATGGDSAAISQATSEGDSLIKSTADSWGKKLSEATSTATTNTVSAAVSVGGSSSSIALSNTKSSISQMSLAESIVASNASLGKSQSDSIAESKIQSSSKIASENFTWADSVTSSQSLVVSALDSDTAKEVSEADSAVLSTSKVVSSNKATAESASVSSSVVVSDNRSIAQSATVSSSKANSETESTLKSNTESYAASAATSNSKVMSTNLSTTYALSKTSSQSLSTTNSVASVLDTNITSAEASLTSMGSLWTIRLSKTSRVAGIALIGDPTTSSNEFVVMTDSFKVIDTAEGYAPKLVFTTGLVGGVGAVGINGNVLIDGTIAATQVGANQIVTSAANIKDAVILTAKISDAQITSAKISNVTADKIDTGTLVAAQITLSCADTTNDVWLAAGKSDFTTTDTGFILGLDADDSKTPKFIIGTSTRYLLVDPTATNPVEVRGKIYAYETSGDALNAEVTTGHAANLLATGANAICAYASSASGYGGWFDCGSATKGPICITPYDTAAPTNSAQIGSLKTVNPGGSGVDCKLYICESTGTSWKLVGPLTPATTVTAVATTAVVGTSVNYAREDHAHNGMMMKHGQYTGNGADDRSINIGVNLSAMTYVFLIVRNLSNSEYTWFKTKDQTGDESWYTGSSSALAANYIQAFTSTGFQVGSDNAVNGNTDTIQYVVFYQK